MMLMELVWKQTELRRMKLSGVDRVTNVMLRRGELKQEEALEKCKGIN